MIKGMRLSWMILTIIVAVQCKVMIDNLGDDFWPKNEIDYVNYIKLILGRQDLATAITKELAELAATKKPEDVVDRVVIAFIPYATKTDKSQISSNEKEIQIKGKLLQQLIIETPLLFIITSLPASQEARLYQLIQAYKKDKKIVHVIRGPPDQVRSLGNMLNMEGLQNRDKIHHPQHGPSQ